MYMADVYEGMLLVKVKVKQRSWSLEKILRGLMGIEWIAMLTEVVCLFCLLLILHTHGGVPSLPKGL